MSKVKRMGRPTEYIPEMAVRLLEAMQSGKVTVAMVCRELGISRATFYNYVNDHDDFKEAYELGQVYSEAWWDELGMQGMIGKKIDATLYCAFRNNISGWRKGNSESDTTVNIGNINVLNQLKELTTEELEAKIAKKLDKLQENLPKTIKSLDNDE